jgi:hypothetical protein
MNFSVPAPGKCPEKTNVKEVTAKVMRTLIEVLKNSKNFINVGQSVPLPKGMTLKEMLCR